MGTDARRRHGGSNEGGNVFEEQSSGERYGGAGRY